MKVRGVQIMINKDKKKLNLHDLQERQEETNHTQSIWNSTLSEQGCKRLNPRNLKSGVHVLFFWFIVCRSVVLGRLITHSSSFPTWNKKHCTCYKVHTNGSNRKKDTEYTQRSITIKLARSYWKINTIIHMLSHIHIQTTDF